MTIILASKSERRREILTMFGVNFTVLGTDTDETADETWSPVELVRELSKRKAEAGVQLAKGITIGADTIVSCGGEIFGKPADLADAKRMLSTLNNKWHEVHTGITITTGIKTITEVETTRVKFRQVDDWEIETYLQTCIVLDKAGAYAIQERAGMFIERIEGDYYNIVGLPICRLSMMLKEFGVYI
ncbi:MAG: Maf family protein [Oscillospiraceae bacterium]|nr:Maf family protein [Oscillospiraceae bacterium]